MNIASNTSKFLVYIHTSPKGKKYVGITSKSANERWQSGGKGYKNNLHFWNAIQKYGWDNFTHEVVAVELPLESACKLESELIAQYDTMNPDHGYNHTTGGNYSTPDLETRKRLSRAIRKCRKEHPEVREKIAKSLKGHVVSQETRDKISKSHTGKKMSEEFCQKQRARKHKPETIAKLKGYSGWAKGLTKDTDPRVRKISESLKGRQRSTEYIKKLSASRKAQYENGYDPIWINNGVTETTIQRGSEIPEGFMVGRLGKLDTYIYKDNIGRKIAHDDLAIYLADGWICGRPPQVGKAIQKVIHKMHYEYLGMRFETSKELAEYLRDNGYPRIVSSTITALCIKGFETSPTYNSLAGKVVKVLHEDKIN